MKVFFASIVLYLLLAAVSAGVHRGTRDQVASQLRLQVDAWWWIFPIVSLALALYPSGPFLLSMLIGALAARELSALAGNRRGQFLLQFALFSLVAIVPAADARWLPCTAAIAAASLLSLLVIGSKNDRLIWLVLLLTALSMSFLGGFVSLAQSEVAKLAWLFFLFVVTALNDIGQYVFGTLFGRTRVAPAISPNKTWQGVFGGIAISVAVSLCLGNWLELSGSGRLIMYAVALSVAGFFGDLLFSAVKRSLGIKDFSNLIPGHGGVLDRVDSLVFTGPLLYLFLRCFE